MWRGRCASVSVCVRDKSHCRKVEIVQFARQTRLLLVRLLALVKWTGDSNSVQECAVSFISLPSSTPFHSVPSRRCLPC